MSLKEEEEEEEEEEEDEVQKEKKRAKSNTRLPAICFFAILGPEWLHLCVVAWNRNRP